MSARARLPSTCSTARYSVTFYRPQGMRGLGLYLLDSFAPLRRAAMREGVFTIGGAAEADARRSYLKVGRLLRAGRFRGIAAAIGTGSAGTVLPDAVAILCANRPRPTKCGSRIACSNGTTTVTQQSAAANIGRHSSDVRATKSRPTAARVASGSRVSSTNSAVKPIADVKVSQNFCLDGAAGDNLAVLGGIKLIARRAANEPHFAGFRKLAARAAERQCIPAEGEHRVGHGDVDKAALPAPVLARATPAEY